MPSLRDTDAVRSDMRTLLRMLDTVRTQYPRMELNQLAVLLNVMAEPGVREVDLRKKTGINKSALNRCVRGLSHESYLKDAEGKNREGLGLIKRLPEGKEYMLAPTGPGRRLAEHLSSLMRE